MNNSIKKRMTVTLCDFWVVLGAAPDFFYQWVVAPDLPGGRGTAGREASYGTDQNEGRKSKTKKRVRCEKRPEGRFLPIDALTHVA